MKTHNDSYVSDKADLTHTLKFKEEVKNNYTYFMVDGYSIDITVRDHAHFELENLFNGDKRLSAPVLQVANDNWNILIDELKEEIAHTFSLLGVQISRAVFNNVPIYDIFLKD